MLDVHSEIRHFSLLLTYMLSLQVSVSQANDSQLSLLFLPDPTTDLDPVIHLGQVNNTVLTDVPVSVTVGVCGKYFLCLLLWKKKTETL